MYRLKLPLANLKAIFLAFTVIYFVPSVYAQEEIQVLQSFNRRVLCDRPPIITCPADVTTCPGASIDIEALGCATAKPGSISCQAPIVDYIDNEYETGSCPGAKKIRRIWTATDPDDENLRSFCIQYIDLKDEEPPVFFNCPKDTVILSNSKCVATYQWTSPWVTDHCGNLSLSSSHINGDKFPVGTTRVIFTATDACGNSSTCSFTIRVVDNCCNQPPTITCPANLTLCYTAGTNPDTTGRATATTPSPACGQVSVNYRDSVVNISNCSVVIYRIWTASIAAKPNLISSCIQRIEKTDNTPPVFLHCQPDITASPGPDCKVKVDWYVPIAEDACGAVNTTSNYLPLQEFTPGFYTVLYVATDGCGNSAQCSFTITVTDSCCNKPPTISCPADATVCPGSSIDPSITGKATATRSGAICDDPIVSRTDEVLYQSACSTVIVRHWRAFDRNQPTLEARCDQRITQTDNTPPVFLHCQPDITASPGPDCKVKVDWYVPIAEDACGAVNTTSNYLPLQEFTPGLYTVLYVATDGCGNSAQCSFTITVTDTCCNQPPTISCPADLTLCPGTSTDTSNTGSAKVTKGGTFCKDPVLTFADRVLFQSACSTRIERTWTAVDPDHPAYTVHCVQTITLEDKTSPVFSSCPVNFTVDPGADCKAIVNWTLPTVSDNCGQVNLGFNYAPGSELGIGNTLVVYTATDDCGNTSSCWFTVTVTDNCCNKPPTITCPANLTVCPVSSLDPSITGTATAQASPHCQPPVITYTDSVLYQSACSTFVERTWTATDPNNSTYTVHCVQTITLEDKTSPIFSSCPVNFTVDPGADCKAIVNWTVPTVSDNCGQVNLGFNYAPGSELGIGNTLVVYTATDDCGNTSSCWFTVTVTDNCCNKPPTITCPADLTLCPGANIDPQNTGRPTATKGHPSCDDPIVSRNDEVLYQSACSTVIVRHWRAFDRNQSSLEARCDQRIVMEDTTPPVFLHCQPDITINPNPDCKVKVDWYVPVAEDACGIVNTISNYLPLQEFSTGFYTVLYVATDACGNSAQCSFTITVTDSCCNKPPTITCPSNFTVCPLSSIDPSITGRATAQASPYCLSPVISFTDSVLYQSACSTYVERTWKATDANNTSLTASCIQYITKEDKTSPVFSACPVDFTVDPTYDCKGIASWTPPTVSDACGSVFVGSNYKPGDQLNRGNTLVVYTATDDCGNTSTCWFTVTVTDNCCDKNPVISCPADYKACPSTSTDPSNTGTATAVPGKPTCKTPVISYKDKILSNGPCSGAIKIERTWTATDPEIPTLKSECKQIIELKDDVNPRFTSVPHDTVINANGQCDLRVYWLPPVAADNCGVRNMSSSHRPGDRFGAGMTTVSYTVVDVCGNSISTSFKITVYGSEIEITCPPDTMVKNSDPYKTGAIVNWNLPTVRYCTPCVDSLPGFIYMGEYGGHRYFCSLAPASWDEAKVICTLNGGHLAVINDQSENEYVSSKLMGQTAWIGGTDENTEGLFEWVNREGFIYRNWLIGQPNNMNGNEDYIELRPDGYWNDQNGASSREFVCEIPCWTLTQIEGPKRGTEVPCGTHRITYVASKDGGKDTCSFNVQVKCDSLEKYCNSRGRDSRHMWVDSVSISTLHHHSGNNGGYYKNITECPEIYSGQTYTVSFTPGYAGVIYNVYWKVWIDYNADGIFDNLNELATYGFGNTIMIGNITIPNGLSPRLSRMRVSMAYGGYPSGPCSTFLYGEVEDHCVSINGGTSFGGSTEENEMEIRTPQTLKCLGGCLDLRSELKTRKNDLGDVQPLDAWVYPNPSDHQVFVQISEAGVSQISFYNAQSKLIWKSVDKTTEDKFEINTSAWPSGVYQMIVEGHNGQKISKRFTVQH